MGIASIWLREKAVPMWVRVGIALWRGLICVSVAFVKQHSVADIFAAMIIWKQTPLACMSQRCLF